MLDFVQLRQDGRLAPEALTHQTEEEFRRIKWPLLNAIAHREGARPAANNIVLVTSAIPGEGKTFNALNLALSIARDRDLEVLLVDGDVAQPSLTASLGLTGRPGITNLLRDTALVLDDIVYSTNIPQLEVVPAGVRHDNAPELLASMRMDVVVGQLCARTSPGVVIVDSPPVLATNEAQVMTRYAGQVLMVVRADFDRTARVDRGTEPDRPFATCERRAEPGRAFARQPLLQPLLLRLRQECSQMTGRGLSNPAIRFALTLILLHGVAAKAEPYGYDLRSQFVREKDPEERPPGLDLKPRIDSALYFVGNINLAENSADEIDTAGIEGAPGLFASYRSPRADATLDYTLIARAFEASEYDSVSHLLGAHGTYMLAQDLFWIDAQAGYSDSIIDAGAGDQLRRDGPVQSLERRRDRTGFGDPEAQQAAGRVPFRCQLHVRTRLVLRVRRRGELRSDLHRLQRGLRGPARLRQSRHQRS